MLKSLAGESLETGGLWNGRHRLSPVYYRSDLFTRDRIAGPALIIQDEATIVVPPRVDAVVEQTGDITLLTKARR